MNELTRAVVGAAICFAAGYLLIFHLWPFAAGLLARINGARPATGQSDDYCRIVLGVGEEATPDDLRRAYQARLGKYDPEHFATYGPEFQELARTRCQAAEAAYNQLLRNATVRMTKTVI